MALKKLGKKGKPLGKKALAKRTPKMPEYKADLKKNGFHYVLFNKAPKSDLFPKINRAKVYPETYYKVDPEIGKVVGLATKIVSSEFGGGEFYVGWDRCGGCHNYFSVCLCKTGLHTPRSVEYIRDREDAIAKGEEWNYLHPNYKGSFSREDRERRAARDDGRFTRVYTPPKPQTPTTSNGKKRLNKIKATKLEPPRKQLGKDKDTGADVFKNGRLDKTALDKATKKSADDLTKQLEQRLGKKSLTKKKGLKKR